MFKKINQNIYAFNVECLPDANKVQRLYQFQDEMEDSDIFQTMWDAGGANEEDPIPYLKTILCRVVSIAAVIRKK